MIKDKFKQNLQKLMNDSLKQNELYLAGNYWKYYEKNLVKQINNYNLSKFRSWEGGAGRGNIQSFGGGSEVKGRTYLRNFHPLDDIFNFIDDSFLIKKYNSLINILIPYIPFLKYFLMRTSELKTYYKNLRKNNIIEKYNLIKIIDKDLLDIEDSKFGLNDNEIVHINGKIYTNRFLNELLKINFVKKNTNFKSISSIIELGAGTGLLASSFLKLNRKIKYLIIDIPPTICFSDYYLSHIGFKVFNSLNLEKLGKNKKINLKKIFKNYHVICLPPWEVNRFEDFKFDLFINVASFQEMEKKQVFNYLSIFRKHLKKYIYICYNKEDKPKAITKNSFGVLNLSSVNQIENALLDEYKIIDKHPNLRDDHYDILFKKR